MTTKWTAQGPLAQGADSAATEARLLKAWSHEFLHVAMMSAFVSLGCNAMQREQRARLLQETAANLPDSPAVHRALKNGLLTLPTRYAAAQYVVQDAYALVTAATEAFEHAQAKVEAGLAVSATDLNNLAQSWKHAAQELSLALNLIEKSGMLNASEGGVTTLQSEGPERVGQLLAAAISGETLTSSGMRESDKGEMPDWAERRRWERKDSDMTCVVTVLGNSYDAIIRNVSLGGALVDNMPPLSRMTPVTITLDTSRILTAKVMWSRDNSIGVKFDHQLLYNDPLVAAG